MLDVALEEAQRADGERPSVLTAFILARKEMYTEAIAEFERVDMTGWPWGSGLNVGIRGHLAHAYIKVGRLDKARVILRELQDHDEKEGLGAYEVGFVYGALGKSDEAFRWLERAFQKRDPGLINRL